MVAQPTTEVADLFCPLAVPRGEHTKDSNRRACICNSQCATLSAPSCMTQMEERVAEAEVVGAEEAAALLKQV